MTVGLVLPAPPRLASLLATLLKIYFVVVRWSPASMAAFIYCLASGHTTLAHNLASTSWRALAHATLEASQVPLTWAGALAMLPDYAELVRLACT
jgi:hypothetical protein